MEFLLVLALAVTGVTQAQERFGSLTGTVTDQQGASIPGVTVTVTNAQTGEVRTFVTDGNGQFSVMTTTAPHQTRVVSGQHPYAGARVPIICGSPDR